MLKSSILNPFALFNFLTPIIDHLDIAIDIKLALAAIVVHISDLAKNGTFRPSLQYNSDSLKLSQQQGNVHIVTTDNAWQ